MPIPVSSTSKRTVTLSSPCAISLALRGNPAALGELERIGGVVEQRLLQPRGIATEVVRQRGGLDVETESFVPGLWASMDAILPSSVSMWTGGILEGELAGLDLRKIEDGVDDLEQMVACRLDLVELVGLLRAQAGAPEDMGHAGDGIERRPDLVAHVREEGALRDVRCLGGLLCDAEIPGLVVDKFLQVMSMPLQFEFVVLARRDVEDHPDQVIRLPARAVVAAAAFAHPELVACCIGDAVLQFVRAMLGHPFAHDPVDHRHIVGVDDARVAAHLVVDEILDHEAGEFRESGAEILHRPVGIEPAAIGESRNAFDQFPEAYFTFHQLLVRQLALGNVFVKTEDADHLWPGSSSAPSRCAARSSVRPAYAGAPHSRYAAARMP